MGQRYKDAAAWTQKQVTRSQAASGDYARGAQTTDKDPMALARQAIPKWKQNVIAPEAEAKLNASLSRVSKQDWQNAVATKGAQRYGPGVAAAAPKIQAFAQQFGSFLATAVPQVDAMPSTTYEERKARANKMMDLAHGFKRT